jgi:hypothetical protein
MRTSPAPFPHRVSISRLVRLVLASLLCVLGVSSFIASRANAATVTSSTLGVYVGGGNTSAFSSFSTWLGAKPSYVVDFLTDSSWSTIDNPSWTADQWANSGARLVLAVPMIPASGATLAAGATGAYNSYFRTLAQSLAADGAGNAIIRLGWEMNGSWFPWSIGNGNATNYATYWQQIVTTMRAVSPSFQFDWCPTNGSSTVNGTLLNPAAAYPGNAYVDYIGMDIYDQSWVSNASNEANRWQGYLTQPYGLQWQKSFAAQNGKPVSFPEWGLMEGGNGGGDSPAFIQDMYNWMSQSNLAYQDYFDFSNSTLTDFPSSEALYQQLFASAGSTSTAPTTPVRSSGNGTPVRGHAASVKRPMLRVKRVRRAGRTFVELQWRAWGASVTIFGNQRRLRTEHHRSSLVVRSASRRAVSYYVCAAGTHVCSAHHRIG